MDNGILESGLTIPGRVLYRMRYGRQEVSCMAESSHFTCNISFNSDQTNGNDECAKLHGWLLDASHIEKQINIFSKIAR